MNMDIELEAIACRINWYTKPDKLLGNLPLFLAQVMARGSADDIVTIQRRFAPQALREAYLSAPPGLFTKRAWAYWGLMLLNDSQRPLPERFAGANQFDWRKSS
jgi:hypothetical protein